MPWKYCEHVMGAIGLGGPLIGWLVLADNACCCCCPRLAGEINTLQGNLNWVASREHELSNPIWKGRESELMPLCNAAQSDSANLDNVAELMVRTGADPQEALMLLVPEAYRNHPDLMKEYPEVGWRDAYTGCMHTDMP